MNKKIDMTEQNLRISKRGMPVKPNLKSELKDIKDYYLLKSMFKIFAKGTNCKTKLKGKNTWHKN